MTIHTSHRWIAVVVAVAAMFTLFGTLRGEARPEPGKIPLDYPKVATTAKTGQAVLCPPRLWVDQAFEKGVDKQNFVFYGATMVQPGPVESKVKTLPGKEEMIPNALIIPLRKAEKAKVGDILLTWWQSGSGMNRALVVKGGTATVPRVRYLDMELDNPSGCGKAEDTCKADTFHLLKKAGEPGTLVAYKDKTMGWKYGHVVNQSGNKILVIGFAGFLTVQPRTNCVALPVRPVVKVGDSVMAPFAGVMVPAKVLRIDPAIGRLYLTGQFWKKEKPYAAAFGMVIPKLP